jgi:zinc transporter ZupT
MDGFVIPLGFEVSSTVGTVIAAAIILHQIPDSFAAASIGMTGFKE